MSVREYPGRVVRLPSITKNVDFDGHTLLNYCERGRCKLTVILPVTQPSAATAEGHRTARVILDDERHAVGYGVKGADLKIERRCKIIDAHALVAENAAPLIVLRRR